MPETGQTADTPPNEPFRDTTPYGCGPDDSVSDATESAAVTQHKLKINGAEIRYTARAGHLVTTDRYSALPTAKIFYVAFTANDDPSRRRPVTFFYNGGPGSSSVFLLLGSFGPRRINTALGHIGRGPGIPIFTPPAPYELDDNPDSLLDLTDLVFINPVGTGYSTAIAPETNRNFWGVDEDATCITAFIKRYLTEFNRWNSPKFLFGESYGTPRTCVLTWLLHEDGVDLNGIVLQSSILDGSQMANPVGLLPTLAANAWFHEKVTPPPAPAHLKTFAADAEKFALNDYATAATQYAETGKVDPGFLQHLSDIVGISPAVLLAPSINYGPAFLTSLDTTCLTGLRRDKGLAVGAYDGRVTAVETGIAGLVAPNSGGNDPTMTALGGVFTAMWNVYLNDELQFTSTSPFMDVNDQAFLEWNWAHTDPTGAQKGGSQESLYTAGDLAGAMALNPYLQVFAANGYYDAVTPFFRTKLDLDNMPLDNQNARNNNLTFCNYESGHMVYLDDKSRSKMKTELVDFYNKATRRGPAAGTAALAAEQTPTIIDSRYQRRVTATPY